MKVSTGSLPEQNVESFRFQAFVDDAIEPALHDIQQPVPFGLDSLFTGSTPGGTWSFVNGEFREAVAMAALGVASSYFPREQFSDYLNSLALSTQFAESVPSPVGELPTVGEARKLAAEVNMDPAARMVMPTVIDLYASLARQTRSNNYLRKFNIELLFAPSEYWESAVAAFSSAARTCVEVGGSLPDQVMWLLEGLDAYFDLAEDLGGDPTAALSGRSIYFSGNLTPMVDLNSIIKNAEHGDEPPPLFAIAAWRFGGQELGEQVTVRTRQLQNLMTNITGELSVIRAGWRIRALSGLVWRCN